MNRLQQLQSTLQTQPSSPTPDILDYVIIGAGVSGLQAAEILSANNKSFKILEAQHSVGGRIQTLTIGQLPEAINVKWIQENSQVSNFQIEKGATWLEADHEMTLQLAREFGIKLRVQHCQGRCLYVTASRNYTNQQLMNDEEIAPDILQIVKKFEVLATKYDQVVLKGNPRSPEAHRMLAKYDSMTISQYLRKQIRSEFVRVLMDNFIEHTECADCDKNSMHEALLKTAQSNDIQILKEFLGQYTHQDSYLFEGGTERLLFGFLHKLEKNLRRPVSDILHLGHTVVAIDNDPIKPYCVVTAENDDGPISFKCRKVILGTPIAVSRAIRFSHLSEAKRLIFESQVRNVVKKSFLITKTPFWRHRGFTGDLLFDDEYNINMGHDISPENESCGILVLFHCGKKHDRWQKQFPNATTKKAYLRELMGKMFLENFKPGQAHPLLEDMVFVESGYSANQFIKSGFQSTTKPGTFKKLLEMGETLESFYRDQHNIIFLGSEYSKECASYIEGAVRVSREKIYQEVRQSDPIRSSAKI